MSELTYFAFRTYQAPAADGTSPFNTYSDFNTFWFFRTYAGTSTEDLVQYYANLLILQYRGLPRAYKTIETVVTPVIMNQLPNQIQNAFNLIGSDTAIGVQLDTLGKYVGVTRSGNGFYGPITLDDENFLTLIRMGIVRNGSSSSLAAIQKLLHQFFAGEVFVFDYKNMNMSYLINSSIGNQDIVQLFITEKLLPKPMGVGISVILSPAIDMFFGFVTYDAEINPQGTPFNTYDFYSSDYIWVSYSDAVISP